MGAIAGLWERRSGKGEGTADRCQKYSFTGEQVLSACGSFPVWLLALRHVLAMLHNPYLTPMRELGLWRWAEAPASPVPSLVPTKHTPALFMGEQTCQHLT